MEVEKQQIAGAVDASDEDYPARTRPAAVKSVQFSKRQIGGLVACLIALPLAVAVYSTALRNDQPLDAGVLEAAATATAGVSNDSFSKTKEKFLGSLLAPPRAPSNSSTVPKDGHHGSPPTISDDSSNDRNVDNLGSPLASPVIFKDSSALNDPNDKHAGGGSHDFSDSSRDKTLGGLLPSGMDEASCFSRYNSVFYRKPSSYKPSSYLIKILRKYEKLHKRCGPWSEQYKSSIQQLQSGQYNENQQCKYVIWIYNSGLGNRIVSLTSTFLYALLTDRVLLIDKNVDMSDLFCDPFPGSSWFLSHFPLTHVFSSSDPGAYQKILKDHKSGTRALPPYVYFNLANGNSIEDRHFFCEEDQLYLQRVPWLVILSNQYFLPGLFPMSVYQERLSQMFPDKTTVFHHLGRYLFHPTNEVWGLITRFYDGYLAKADTRLGIQVRIFNKQSMPYVTDHIIGCALNEKLLPMANAEEQFAQTKNTTRTKAVVMASLYSTFYDNIKNMYWEHPTMTGETITVYQPSHEELEQRGKKLHEMKALSEMFLLSMSDDLITSAMSTFGYVAQGLGAVKPWILNVHHTNKPKIPCNRAVSLEPCFHFPPYYDCKARKIDINMVLPPFFMQCQDMRGGLKLVQKIS